MNPLTAKLSEPPRRNFETDVPRAEPTAERNPISNRLWAGMAAAAVVSTLGVGALAGPAPKAELSPPPDAITTTVSPDTRVFRPLAAVPLDEPHIGAAKPRSIEPTTAQVPAPAEAAAPAAPAEVPAPPAPQPPPGPPGDANFHTVVPGDTVAGIAGKYGLDTDTVLAANGLGVYSIIVPGQTLKLSGPAVAASAPNPAPAQAPAAAAPAAAPPAVPAPAPVQAAPVVRTIYVAGAGGQAMLDACIGPIHYTPNDGYSLFITEHDFCGGWARFSGIGVGEAVSIPGYGTYTATARGQVPNPGTTNDVIAVFGGFPRAILQTCIPGTNQMLLIALN